MSVGPLAGAGEAVTDTMKARKYHIRLSKVLVPYESDHYLRQGVGRCEFELINSVHSKFAPPPRNSRATDLRAMYPQDPL